MTEQDIKKIALDYIEGWFEGNSDRMQNALHPKLVKRRFVSAEEIWNVDTPQMIELTKKGQGKIDDPKSGVKGITVLSMDKNMASVKVVSVKFIDYLLMIKENDQWKIVDVVWDYV